MYMYDCIVPVCMILYPVHPYVANATKPLKNEVISHNNHLLLLPLLLLELISKLQFTVKR